MKNLSPFTITLLACLVTVLVASGPIGCGTTATQIATNTETVAVPSVDAAMHTWANYCAGTNATAAQILTVSNAYNVYFNAQIVASNVLAYAANNPGTTVNITNVLGTASASAGAVVNIITTFTK